jgi:uncharacterized protein YcfJ
MKPIRTLVALGLLSLAGTSLVHAQTYGPQDEGRRFNDGSRVVCNDVEVRRNSSDPNRVGGTAAGAVIGGLVGNQIGSGNGRKLATAAGATAGGFVGNRVDRNHVGGRVTERVDRQCRTVQDSSQSSRVVAYNVSYRNPDGTTGSMRTDAKPGNRILLGDEERTVGYDVTYVYDGTERTIRMDERPDERLPVINGRIMTAALDTSADTSSAARQ